MTDTAGRVMDVQRDKNEQILVLLCLNDLYFLYKHVINALDSYCMITIR